MTVTSNTNKTQPLGNGVTTSFPYSFRIYSASDLVVTRTVIATGVDTDLVLNADYTVTGAGSYNGGNVVFSVAPASGTRITIRRVMAVTQGTDLRNQGAYFAETHEDVFDRHTMVDQQLQESIDRAVSFPSSDNAANGILPSAELRANKALVFDAGGNVGVSVDDYDDQAANAAASASAAAASAATATTAASTATAASTSASSSASAAATSASAAAASAAEATAGGGGGSSTYAQVADRVERDGKMLRRAIDSVRYAPVTENRQYAYTSLNSAKKTNTDGGNKTVWEPDGSGVYGHSWTRDQAMCMEGYLDYFGADEIAAVANYFLSKSNLATGEVPDHISHAGVVYWTPGNTNNWGSRAPVDGNTYLLQMFWLHFVKTGSASLYNTNKVALKGLIETGIPYNGATGCVTISNTSPFVGFGFYDTAKVTGDVLFPSILAYRAFLQAAEMEFVLGNTAEALRLQARADTIKAGINSTLRNYYDTEAGSPNYVRKLGFYKAATIKGAGQLDMWGTLFAVWSEVPEEGFAKMIASNVQGIASDTATPTVYQGAVRHVVKGTDYSAGVASWEAYFLTPTFGAYQNGGFWHTATPWLCYALALVDPAAAKAQYSAMITSMQAQSGTVRPVEWLTNTGGSVGASKYGTSAVAPLMCGDALPYNSDGLPGPPGTNGVGVPTGGTAGQVLAKNSSTDYDFAWVAPGGGAGSGDLVSPLVNAEISVTTTATLTVGKMHVCSGTSADYTVTLPAVSGNAGKFVGVRMAGALTRLVTVKGDASELIDGLNTRVMWANESAILYCDGAAWVKVAGKSIPMSAVMRRTTAQTVTFATWVKIVMTSVVRDNTSALAAPCADTTNGYFKVRRPGLYQASGFVSITGAVTGMEVNGGCALNSASPGDNPNSFNTVPAPSSTYCQVSGGGTFECATNDYINTITQLGVASGSYSTRAVGTVYPTLSVTEIPNW